jgi:CHAD domain-containing protein
VAYRLENNEPVAASVRRCAIEELEDAIQHLQDGADDETRAVHEARKSIKKTRALLRLARSCIDGPYRQAQMARLREAARSLAQSRDASVALESLDLLAARYPDQLSAAAVDRVREAISPPRAGQHARSDVSEALEAAAKLLSGVCGKLAGMELRADGWELVEPGLRRSYLRGRERLAEVVDDPSPERLHEWRKRVKDLWHAAQILRPADPKRLRPLARDAHALSDLLGDDHDLAVLRAEALRGRREYFVDSAERDALTALIDRRRAELRRAALDLGAKVYARKPRALRGQTPSVGATQGV